VTVSILEDTLASEVRETNSKAGEVKWVKAIIYGNKKNALLLLNKIGARNMNVSWFFLPSPKGIGTDNRKNPF